MLVVFGLAASAVLLLLLHATDDLHTAGSDVVPRVTGADSGIVQLTYTTQALNPGSP